MTHKIYADFNGVREFPNDNDYEYIDLCGYGTIGDLSHYEIKLSHGMELTFYEPGDVEVDATVVFISSKIDQHNPHGKWFGKFTKGSIRVNDDSSEYDIPQSCFNCKQDLKDYLKEVGQQYKEVCPNCSTSIMYPLLPPATIG